ncbi:MAG: GNAT family N-acetyltransferase [Armatimonadota bacterium]
MLDKSVPYVNVIMRRDPGAPIPEFEVPAGYTIVGYQPGDEIAWGEIESSVLEFETPKDATEYFLRDYVAYDTEVKRRTLFAKDATGRKVGTFTAWWNYTGLRRVPFLHWVAVLPEHQGRGVGKALVAAGVRLMVEIEGDCEMFLHTQTWSHKAIRIYRWAGFELDTQSELPGGYSNDTQQALPILEGLI